MHTSTETKSMERSIFCIKMYIQSSNRMLTYRKCLAIDKNIHILVHQCMHLKIYMNYSDLIKNKDLSTKDILNSLHLASFLSMSINNFISEKALKPNISFHTHTHFRSQSRAANNENYIGKGNCGCFYLNHLRNR